jgi:hypothetical protein
MLHYVESMTLVDDLKVCLIRNRTTVPFITSDNPCILANRWHQTDQRARGYSFGAGKAGCLFLLPLSAEVACILYDGDVYSLPNQGGWLTVRKPADIDAFNEHQVLSCGNNLYFRNWDHADYVSKLCDRTLSRRLEESHRCTLAVLGETTDWGQRYDVVSRDQIQSGQDTIVHVETLHSEPNAWPSFLGFRSGGKVYSNGSRTGYVRAWSVDQGFASGHGYRALKA